MITFKLIVVLDKKETINLFNVVSYRAHAILNTLSINDMKYNGYQERVGAKASKTNA